MTLRTSRECLWSMFFSNDKHFTALHHLQFLLHQLHCAVSSPRWPSPIFRKLLMMPTFLRHCCWHHRILVRFEATSSPLTCAINPRIVETIPTVDRHMTLRLKSRLVLQSPLVLVVIHPERNNESTCKVDVTAWAYDQVIPKTLRKKSSMNVGEKFLLQAFTGSDVKFSKSDEISFFAARNSS
jgi:hypothetical protein